MTRPCASPGQAIPGLGWRLLVTDNGETALFELRSLPLDQPDG